jgi:hypothetical protein
MLVSPLPCKDQGADETKDSDITIFLDTCTGLSQQDLSTDIIEWPVRDDTRGEAGDSGIMEWKAYLTSPASPVEKIIININRLFPNSKDYCVYSTIRAKSSSSWIL